MVGATVPYDEGEGMSPVAAIDCGTNSIRLLVAEVDPESGTLRDLDRRMEIVRLGQDVDRTGRLAPEALERTFAAAEVYAAAVRGARRRAHPLRGHVGQPGRREPPGVRRRHPGSGWASSRRS